MALVDTKLNSGAECRFTAAGHAAVRKEIKNATKRPIQPRIVNYFTAVKRLCALTFCLKLRPPAEIKENPDYGDEI